MPDSDRVRRYLARLKLNMPGHGRVVPNDPATFSWERPLPRLGRRPHGLTARSS